MRQMECTNLTLSYNHKRVVENLSFGVEKGDFLCIVGENGSGKSTLLKGLLGMKKPEEGSIVFGKGSSRQTMGYLPQQESGLEEFPATVREIVRSGTLKSKPFRLFYSKEQKRQAEELIKTLDLDGIADKGFGELSGGQKQRVLLARALGAARDLLILDEPVNGLDPMGTEVLYRAVTQKNKEENMTVIMVSHDLENALAMANKILHLGNHSFFFGSVEDYRHSELGQIFLKGVSSCG